MMPEKPAQSFLRANRRLFAALGCYLVLILTALYTLLPIRSSYERIVLWFVLCVFAILIIRSIIHAMQDEKSE